jgi:hypothetical protein
MTTFYTDSDLVGAAQFGPEAEAALATEFTTAVDGTASFRWRWPDTPPGVTPVVRVWNAAGALVAGPISFDTSDAGAWNTAGVGSPVALTAGTYRVAVNTNRYTARTGFFTAPIVRGDVTGVQGRFGSNPTGAPATTTTATYFIDIDFTADAPEPEPDPDVPVVDEPRVGSALHLARVMQEVALACSAITGLSRFYSYPPASTTAPAGYVSYPSRILYNQTYQRGQADYEDLPIVLIVGRPYERRARDLVADWSAADGPRSVVARLEEWGWQSCDDVTVGSGEFDVETIGGIEYLAIMFKASVVGPGRD